MHQEGLDLALARHTASVEVALILVSPVGALQANWAEGLGEGPIVIVALAAVEVRHKGLAEERLGT